MSSPPSRSQIDVNPESGFGGWADEKIKTAREAAPHLGRKKSHPQHLTIARARPQFIKAAAVSRAIFQHNEKHSYLAIAETLVHTGQHYDLNMSDNFFKDLRLPDPHIHLGVGSGSHAEQAGKVMMAYEKVILAQRPDLVIVVGDVNSTLACTIAASKVSYPENHVNAHMPELTSKRRPVIAHLEAGLRSFDRSMPEEINRIVTDSLADILWTPSLDGDENLLHEGVDPIKIDRVGNIMIDALEMMREKTELLEVYKELGVAKGAYCVTTLHRPANVDSVEQLSHFCDVLVDVSRSISIVFPVHPRTRKNLEKFRLYERLNDTEDIILTEPEGYNRFMSLIFECKFVITDSGGIQEETTYLGIPCFTLRPNTERPVTVNQGTNVLCTLKSLKDCIAVMLTGKQKEHSIPELWDGATADRVVESIQQRLC